MLLLLGLIAGRLALPSAVRWYVNRTLDQDPAFDGSIEGVDIDLYRGAYAVRGVRLDKVTGGLATPLIAVDRLDLSVQWGALLSGALVAEVVIDGAAVNFVDGGDNPAQGQTGTDGPWLQVLTDLVPFTLNRVRVVNSSVHLRSERAEAPVDVYLSQIEAEVNDLSNVEGSASRLNTTARVEGKAMDQASFEVDLTLDPTSYRPTFELAFRLLDLDVTKVNDLARAYGGLDFEAGRFDLTVEAEAVAGQIDGSVKPLFRGLRVFSVDDDVRLDDPLNGAWQLLVGLTAEVFQNQPRDQLGTRVNFSADTTGLDTSVLEVVVNVLRNAFVQAYLPRLREEGAEGFTFSAPEITD